MAANPVTPGSELQVDTEKTADETILHFSGRLTSSTASLLQSTVQSAIPESKTIILDLSDVSYMDSSGLGALVKIWVSAKRDGWELKVLSLSQRVKQLLHLTGVDKLFASSRFPKTPSF